MSFAIEKAYIVALARGDIDTLRCLDVDRVDVGQLVRSAQRIRWMPFAHG